MSWPWIAAVAAAAWVAMGFVEAHYWPEEFPLLHAHRPHQPTFDEYAISMVAWWAGAVSGSLPTAIRGLRHRLHPETFGAPPTTTMSHLPMSPALARAMGCLAPEDAQSQRQERQLPAESRQGYIRAWRAWHLGADARGPVLRSTVMRQSWSGPIATADGPPSAGSLGFDMFGRLTETFTHHGLYALKPMECARLFHGYAQVVGEVDLFGKVVEHDRGYRAEKAIIRKLYLVPGVTRREPGISGTWLSFTLDPDAGTDRTTPDALADRYDCEVDTTLGRQMAEFFASEAARAAESQSQEKGEEETWTSASPGESSRSCPARSTLHPASDLSWIREWNRLRSELSR